MIDRLSDLPALSAGWLAPLQADDPERYAELAESIVITPATRPITTGLPAGPDARGRILSFPPSSRRDWRRARRARADRCP